MSFQEKKEKKCQASQERTYLYVLYYIVKRLAGVHNMAQRLDLLQIFCAGSEQRASQRLDGWTHETASLANVAESDGVTNITITCVCVVRTYIPSEYAYVRLHTHTVGMSELYFVYVHTKEASQISCHLLADDWKENMLHKTSTYV